MTVKTFSKSQRSWLVMLAGNL